MAVYSLLVVLVGVALCVDHVTGQHSERQEDGRSPFQLCEELLDETVPPESLRTAHDRIRDRRLKKKLCEMHMGAEKQCPDPKPPHYGTYHDTNNSQNVRTVIFECASGYRLLGHSEVTCQFGTWEPDASVKWCIPIPKENDTSITTVTTICALIVCLIILAFPLMVWFLMYRKTRTRSTSRAGYTKGGRFVSKLDSKLGFDGISFSKTTGESGSGFNDSCPDFEESATSLLGNSPRNDTAYSEIAMPLLNYCGKLNGYEYRTKDRETSADVPDQATVSPQRTTKCKEYIYSTKTDQAPAVCRVTPLYAEDADNNDDDSQTDQDPPETGGESPQSTDENTCIDVSLRLNWNLLFRNLVPRVCTDSWKLFAINLLSEILPTGQSVNNTISRIENRSRTQQGGDKIEVIIYHILWHWKDVSKNPRLKDIKKALYWSHHEDVLHDMENVTKNCYVPVSDEGDGVIDKNHELAGIPELEYRPIAQRQTITSFPCIGGVVNLMEAERESHVISPVVPYTEHVTWDYQFASQTGGFRRDNRYYRTYRTTSTNRRFSYFPYQKLRNKYKFDPRKKFPVKSKSKVPLLQKKQKTPRAAVAISFTANDKMCVDLILSKLYLNPERTLNRMEYQMLTKYTIHKIRDKKLANTSLDDLLGITFEEYKGSEHVSTTRSGTLHIISSGELMVMLTDDVWTLVETYVRGARNDAVRRDTNNGGNCLFLTYEGKQVTEEYFHEKSNGTTDQNEIDTQEENLDVKPSERSIDMDTDDEPGNKEMCTATMQSLDCKTESPVSHSSDYVQCTKQVTKDEKINDTADQTENDTQDQDPDVKPSERSIDMDTDADDEPGKKQMCTATMQSFDCKTESPVSRNSDYVQSTKQVTKDEKINDIADQTENDTQDQDPDVKPSERSIDMDTDADEQPGKQEMCTATMQSFDCQTESPVSHNSNYVQCTKQVPLLGKDNNVIHHGRDISVKTRSPPSRQCLNEK